MFRRGAVTEYLDKAVQFNPVWLRDKQTQTDPLIRDRLCNRCGKLNFLRDNTLRLLDDSKTNDLREVQVDALQRQKESERGLGLLEKQTKLLLPGVWDLQHQQQEEDRQLQIKQKEEEIERLKVTRLKELMHDKDGNFSEKKKNKSDWQQKMLLRVLDSRLDSSKTEASCTPAATKSVPVPPPTQQSRHRRRLHLPPKPFSGKMDIVEGC
jgi:septal ring factor EnvC (AmiA/AmiB activator)